MFMYGLDYNYFLWCPLVLFEFCGSSHIAIELNRPLWAFHEFIWIALCAYICACVCWRSLVSFMLTLVFYVLMCFLGMQLIPCTGDVHIMMSIALVCFISAVSADVLLEFLLLRSVPSVCYWRSPHQICFHTSHWNLDDSVWYSLNLRCLPSNIVHFLTCPLTFFKFLWSSLFASADSL